MRPRRSLPIAGMAMVVLVAGCGGREPQSKGSVAAPAQITVTETDFELQPADASVPNAGRLSVKAVNAGDVPHALRLETPQGDRTTPTLAPGETGTLSADVEPGRYTWYCPVANHRELGMTGTLTVKGADRRDAPRREPSTTAPSGGGYGY